MDIQKFQRDSQREAATESLNQAARNLLGSLLAHEPEKLAATLAALESGQFEVSIETRLARQTTTLLWLHEPGREARLLFAAKMEPRADA